MEDVIIHIASDVLVTRSSTTTWIYVFTPRERGHKISWEPTVRGAVQDKII